MKSQPNDRLKGAAKTNAAAILLIPKQNFLTLQVDDYSAKFDRSLRTGILKWLSQKMLLAYEKEHGIGKAAGWKTNGIFSLEKQWLLSNFEENSKGKTCTLMIRQPNFLTETFIQKVYQEIKINNCHPLLAEIKYITTESRLCCQVIHVGSFEELNKSLVVLKQYVQQHHYEYADSYFREIDLVRENEKDCRTMRKIVRCSVREKVEGVSEIKPLFI